MDTILATYVAIMVWLIVTLGFLVYRGLMSYVRYEYDIADHATTRLEDIVMWCYLGFTAVYVVFVLTTSAITAIRFVS